MSGPGGESSIAFTDAESYADPVHSGSNPGRKQFTVLIDAIETGQY